MLTGPSATRRTLNAYLPSTLDAMSAPGIADRTGIHKSCKSLEVVVNVLNDYCEAANALVAIQKKLAKAVREAASAKSINDIASNALTSSAAVLEAVSEVDSKFAKVTDKECDGISAEGCSSERGKDPR
ncbi:hypothetical protein EW026_g2666 [Hermanssonia centrifuga]|uniref:Uncharacterized protein n=1 Tax=Hermanssonia centrifuga TaxID=98765 RepID=A0A4V3XAZ6_9APHY|nr:hypothetical protein EW026_g2666 [Hermanssonia centrifuga]